MSRPDEVGPDEWLAKLFEDEFCAECGGDHMHHQAVVLMGNWFARCLYPPASDGALHPAIALYRRHFDAPERRA